MVCVCLTSMFVCVYVKHRARDMYLKVNEIGAGREVGVTVLQCTRLCSVSIEGAKDLFLFFQFFFGRSGSGVMHHRTYSVSFFFCFSRNREISHSSPGERPSCGLSYRVFWQNRAQDFVRRIPFRFCLQLALQRDSWVIDLLLSHKCATIAFNLCPPVVFSPVFAVSVPQLTSFPHSLLIIHP